MARDLFDLAGQVAIVTGAASGLGRAIAEGLAEYGATVVATDIAADGLPEVVSAIEAHGRQGLAVPCDVTQVAQVTALAQRTVATFERIDILVNAAGIARRVPAVDMTEAEWDDVLDVDLKGAWLCCQAVGRVMVQQGSGRVINIASIAGQVGTPSGNANYSAAKGGLISLTRVLAIEWAEHNVLVNAIAPTHFRTPLVEPLYRTAEGRAYMVNNIPLGRLGEPREIVGPVVFLASPAASMVTGATLNVDGGHVAR